MRVCSYAQKNRFTTLPPDISTATNLEELTMAHNDITGPLPDPLPPILSNLQVGALHAFRNSRALTSPHAS